MCSGAQSYECIHASQSLSTETCWLWEITISSCVMSTSNQRRSPAACSVLVAVINRSHPLREAPCGSDDCCSCFTLDMSATDQPTRSVTLVGYANAGRVSRLDARRNKTFIFQPGNSSSGLIPCDETCGYRDATRGACWEDCPSDVMYRGLVILRSCYASGCRPIHEMNASGISPFIATLSAGS